MRLLGNDLSIGTMANGQPLVLTREQRGKHQYIVGATGTGKSKAMEHQIRQDILNWPRSRCGLILFDKHGAQFDSVMKWIAATGQRHLPLVPIDLRRTDWVVSYNVLRQRPTGNPSVIVGALTRAIVHAWGQQNMDDTPRLAKWLATILATIYELGFTLMDALHLFSSHEARQAMSAKIKNFAARHVWSGATKLSPAEFQDQIESTVNRLLRFLNNEVMRATLCQPGPSLDLGEALERGSIILVSLATAGTQVDDEDARTFGSMLLSDLWTAAKARGKWDECDGGVKPFYCYVDEFQDFLTPAMSQTLDQARGFGLHFTLAHQFPSQLSGQGELGKRVFDSVMANTRTKMVFQLDHPEDLPMLALWLSRNDVDLDAIKHQHSSRKVMGYSIQYLPSYSNSTTTGTSTGTSRSAGSSTGQSLTASYGTSTTTGIGLGSSSSSSSNQSWEEDPNDPAQNDLSIKYNTGSSGSDSESYFESTGESWSESGTASRTTSQSVTDSDTETELHTQGMSQSPMLIPIMGDELGPPQFRSIEEQLFRFTQLISGQPDRRAIVRLAGTRSAVPMAVPLVRLPLTTSRYVEQLTVAMLEKLPIAVRWGEALRQLDQREATLTELLLLPASGGEPVQFARQIAPKAVSRTNFSQVSRRSP